jgi:hypothetical protein
MAFSKRGTRKGREPYSSYTQLARFFLANAPRPLVDRILSR